MPVKDSVACNAFNKLCYVTVVITTKTIKA